uniref:Euchromatic histone-lysine N-methyltransferase n=1 Tax=Tetraselmis sp. GSL018 TaxID=582737 RepID=A0A061S3D0_9CHLO
MSNKASSEAVEAAGTETIHHAAWRGDRAKIMQFVKQREDLGYPATETLQERDGVTGDTPLHKAVENNQEELVKWLLLQGVMPDVKDNHGVTPLHVAAIKGYFSLVELLLDSDESIKKGVDSNGDTAVHWAATKGHLDVVELLLSRGAAIDIANKQGWTALHRAAFNGRVEVMDRLLNAGASLHAVNQDCNTALHLASHNNHLSAISLLLKWGAKTDMRNAEGLVPDIPKRKDLLDGERGADLGERKL